MSLKRIIHTKPHEDIIFVLHRHPFTFVSTLLLFVVLLCVPIALYLMINNLFPTLFMGDIARALLTLFASVYYLSTYLFFFTRFIDFYLDMWVITTERIIDIEQHGLFHRVITELELFRIQDVTTSVKGIIATFFDYGDVIVKTASSTAGIVFFDVPHPNKIRNQLIHLAEVDRTRHHTNT